MIIAFAEDLGRHSALDKAIGKCLLDKIPMKGADSKEDMEEKIKGKRIDFSKVFDDVNKEFGL